MERCSISIDIAAPATRVWEVMSDVDHWHEWTPSIIAVRRFGADPFGLGRRALVRQPKLPPALWTVTEFEPGRRFVWVSVAPGLRVSGIHAVAPIDGGARATLAIEIAGLFARPWARLTRGITERYIGFEAVGLKARSEDPAFRHAPLY